MGRYFLGIFLYCTMRTCMQPLEGVTSSTVYMYIYYLNGVQLPQTYIETCKTFPYHIH